MSNRERCAAALELVPESKLGYVLAYIQGLIADVADDQGNAPNAETVAAMQEVNEMIRTGSGQHFKGSAAELFTMLDSEGDDDA